MSSCRLSCLLHVQPSTNLPSMNSDMARIVSFDTGCRPFEARSVLIAASSVRSCATWKGNSQSVRPVRDGSHRRLRHRLSPFSCLPCVDRRKQRTVLRPKEPPLVSHSVCQTMHISSLLRIDSRKQRAHQSLRQSVCLTMYRLTLITS